VDRKDGCQGLPLGALEHQDATDLNAARSGCPHARLTGAGLLRKTAAATS